jgi:thiamine-phosphate pyrophosphorylase
MRGLYAIVDVDALARIGVPVPAFAEAVLDARPAAVQLRDKSSAARRHLALLRELAPLARAARVPLYANDRPDLAILARCDGVHVGQDDVPVALVRRLARASGVPLAVGLSTHDEVHLERAFQPTADDEGPDAVPDYVAVGPVFPTVNKGDADPAVGLAALRERCAWLARHRPGVPLVAIGGISLETAGAVGELCAAVAVIGALLPREAGPRALDEVRDRARAMQAAILGGRT